ncbi:uncharacterized protein BYT42DRAFT_553136 [Radiomyces spectabilis]|uniref:uncharacterized protein n=1 Tax=Radiomyces spectabilis TaxID=64574 RepID=UPI00221F84E0|nr:uncharacterized protein BYT42DRAFT_553136 [Radiomyces spectabilis]KAI8394046.1 hypothetical protein BYT42DRAFT_553136 [Radiomyces spectabilis]
MTLGTMETVCETLNIIELLRSMYFDEFSFRTVDDQALYEQLQTYEEQGTWDQADINQLPETTAFHIRLSLETDSDKDIKLTISCILSLNKREFRIGIPFASNEWLSRESHQSLTRQADCYVQEHALTDDDDRGTQLLEAIEYVQQSAVPLAVAWCTQLEQENAEADDNDTTPLHFVRQWIWFPMIYTREKRGHIVDWAPSYGVTGFLCPGKPGCLCLEGTEKNVVTFINDIKTKSWADIPASHRKMTLRWREEQECVGKEEMDRLRRFPDMKEVMFDIHGNFGNHNSLSMLQDWLNERGCGEAFTHLFEYNEK